MPRVAAEIAYFRRTQGNFTTTDNREVTPADYTEYCVTAPSDPRLPGGGGNQICGLFELNQNRFGGQFADENVVTFVDNFGKQTQNFNGIDFILNARLQGGVFLNGGFATGNESTDECDSYVDNPSASTSGGTTLTPRAWCARDTGWQTSYKVSGSYSIPWQDIQLGAVFQNLPGQQILANWNVTSATPSVTLGRSFNGGGSRNVALIEPGTMYADRRSQLDVRIAKNFRLGGSKRIQAQFDVYNALNSNAAVGATSQAGETPPSLNTTYSSTDPNRPGGAWLTPLNILQGRYAKFGVQFNF
jgi:hypothetical protein